MDTRIDNTQQSNCELPQQHEANDCLLGGMGSSTTNHLVETMENRKRPSENSLMEVRMFVINPIFIP